MSLTVFFVLLRIISNSFLNVLQKKAAGVLAPVEINFGTYFLLAIPCLMFLFVLYPALPVNVLCFASAGGFFGALGNAFLILALKQGELSVLGPLNSYKAVVGLIFALFLIEEAPSYAALWGIVLIIAGSYFIFETKNRGIISAIVDKGVCYRFIALVLTAIEAVFIKKVIILSDTLCAFLLWVICGFVFSYFVLKFSKTQAVQAFKDIKERFFVYAALGALVFLMQFSTNVVFSKITVGAALSLFQLSNILNVFLGHRIFGEKSMLKKLAGSIIMVMGSVIIILN